MRQAFTSLAVAAAGLLLAGAQARAQESSNALQRADYQYASPGCETTCPPGRPRVVVELPPPEVVFRECPAPPVEAGREKKHFLFGRRCHHKAKTSSSTEQATVYATTVMPFQVPAVAVVPASVQAAGCCTPSTAQGAALMAYQEAELRANLAAMDEQKKVLTARLNTLAANRSTSAQAQAGPVSLEELNGRLQRLEDAVARLMLLQTPVLERLEKVESHLNLGKPGTKPPGM